jgi:hypothetical protein
VPDLPSLVAPGGIALLEAAPVNARALEALVRAVLPSAGVETIVDYAELDRLIIAVVPSG